MAEPDRRTPLHVLTGFLGSGKTTLLRAWLADPALADTAVVINELGEIALDHLLVTEVGEGAVVLRNGCVCCSIRTDLQQALRDLQARRAEGSVPPFARVVLETTGLADPMPVVATLVADPVLRHQFRLGHPRLLLPVVGLELEEDRRLLGPLAAARPAARRVLPAPRGHLRERSHPALAVVRVIFHARVRHHGHEIVVAQCRVQVLGEGRAHAVLLDHRRVEAAAELALRAPGAHDLLDRLEMLADRLGLGGGRVLARA